MALRSKLTRVGLLQREDCTSRHCYFAYVIIIVFVRKECNILGSGPSQNGTMLKMRNVYEILSTSVVAEV